MKPFIVFYGPEAAGKTTQINILTRKLARQFGRDSLRIISIRDNHLLIPLITSILKRARVATKFRRGNEQQEIIDAEKLVKDKRIWTLFQLINLLPIYLVRYRLNRKLGKLLIAERFIHDSLGTLAHFMRRPDILTTGIGRFYLRLIPHDAIEVFLYAPYDVLVKRYRATGKRVEPRDLIHYETLIGRKLAKDALSIETSTHSVAQTAQLIESYMKSRGILA